MDVTRFIIPSSEKLKPHPWAWVPHPEVWVMIGILVLLYLYATRVLGPKAVPRGTPIITRKQSRWYFGGLLVLWIAADWPVHDIAEDYLYSVHMVQHMMLMWIVPPMMLMATPEWLPRIVLGRARAYRIFRFFALPLVAGVLYNAAIAVSEIPAVVNLQVESAGFHFSVHLTLIITALLMWHCVCGPLKEMRIGLPMQCVYLFLMGVVPTIPSAWLVFAQGVVYKSYIHPWHSLWGLTPIGDQELAGFIMRTIAGLYLGTILLVLFFRWARNLTEHDEPERRLRDRDRIALARARAAVDEIDAEPAALDPEFAAETAESDPPVRAEP